MAAIPVILSVVVLPLVPKILDRLLPLEEKRPDNIVFDVEVILFPKPEWLQKYITTTCGSFVGISLSVLFISLIVIINYHYRMKYMLAR